MVFKTIDNKLAANGYNLRARANIYAGTLMGALAPITFVRYTGFPKSENLKEEAMYWVGAAVSSIPLSVVGAFFGLIMGDHSKTGINTMFNTGTVVGVSANVFGADFPPKFIPSFSWGGNRWLLTFSFEKSMEVAQRVLERRNLKLEEEDVKILKTVFEREAKYRKR